ncbi:phosphoglycerate mutase family protein [Actinomycetospora lutea]|uniref:histidine phosphatase family protein n=1 Tax=Actinomycetospora lutea TaxID=663604 RepID=UPI002367162D|nr:histidine phosphatase family protein [Actinomycetospora lutea]MDD7937192.1 phosphoglycerate mutase family protein [Actinomycetospora lutea]
MTRVLLIRHGETHGYHDDVGLTEQGEAQARAKGKELAAALPPGARVTMPHAPTARGTATAVTLREVLLAELGPGTDVTVGELVPDARFDSLQFLYAGEARESSGVAKHRIGLEGERPDWARAFDRFDTDFGAGSKAGGPIDRWMVATDLHFEPPQVIAYRAWAGIRAQAAGTVALASSHSALLRAFASAALGHDVGEPRNLEHVDVELHGDRATVTYRDESTEVDVPTVVPPWLDPSYLDAGERTAHRW